RLILWFALAMTAGPFFGGLFWQWSFRLLERLAPSDGRAASAPTYLQGMGATFLIYVGALAAYTGLILVLKATVTQIVLGVSIAFLISVIVLVWMLSVSIGRALAASAPFWLFTAVAIGAVLAARHVAELLWRG
ncbi:MAG: hypothetical protein NZO58_13270, partial [Gemmataceae bacterium]|nr:hypothetical protein [Gemmataceae bacterium]